MVPRLAILQEPLGSKEIPALLALAPSAAGLVNGWMWTHPSSVIHLARLDDRVVGGYVLHRNPIHPTFRSIWILVNPSEERIGVGGALLSHARAEAGERLRAKIPSDDQGGARFAEARGMQCLVRSHELLLDPNDQAVREWLSGHRADSGAIEVAEFDDVVVNAVWTHYQSIHLWDPPVKPTSSTLMELFMTDVVPQDSFVYREAGRVTGIAISHAAQEDCVREVAYLGPTHRSHPQAHQIRTALLARLLKQGLRIHLEVDEGAGANEALYRLCRPIAHPISAPVLIYVDVESNASMAQRPL